VVEQFQRKGGFPAEAIKLHGIAGQLLEQHLDGHWPGALDIVSQEDFAHAAASQQPEQTVSSQRLACVLPRRIVVQIQEFDSHRGVRWAKANLFPPWPSTERQQVLACGITSARKGECLKCRASSGNLQYTTVKK